MTSHVKRGTGAKSAPAKKSRLAFFPEVVAELRKAHWPTRQEALRLSLLVLVVCTVVGGILFAFDSAFAALFWQIIGG